MYQKTAAVILSSFLLSSPSRLFSRILSIGGKQAFPLPLSAAAGGRAALTASPFRHWCPVVWYACRTHATFLHLSARVSYLSQAVLDCRLNDSVVCSLC